MAPSITEWLAAFSSTFVMKRQAEKTGRRQAHQAENWMAAN